MSAFKHSNTIWFTLLMAASGTTHAQDTANYDYNGSTKENSDGHDSHSNDDQDHSSSPGHDDDGSDGYGKGDWMLEHGCETHDPHIKRHTGHCDIWVPYDTATIQEALDTASANQRVCVAPGQYLEQVTLWAENVELVGAGSGLTTIVAPFDTTGPVVTIANSGGLQGVTVQGGTARQGAGVYAAGAHVWLDDVESEHNHCDGRFGGTCQGVGVWVGADEAQLTDVWVHDNSCTASVCQGVGLALSETSAQVVGLVSDENACKGLLRCQGVGVWSSAGEVIGRAWWVHHNETTAEHVGGGGIGVFDSRVTDLEDLVVEHNTALFLTSSSFGGGIALSSSGQCHRVARARVSWNQLRSDRGASVAYGGGISLGSGQLDLRLTELSANIAEAYHAEGGGLRVDGENVALFENGIVTGNLATSEAAERHAPDGGYGGGIAVDTELWMDNVDVVGNAVYGHAAVGGAGISVMDELLYMRNVDIAFNGPRRAHLNDWRIAVHAPQVSSVGGTILGVHGNHYPAHDIVAPRLVEHGAIIDHDYSHWTVPYSNAPWTSLSPNWTSKDPEFVSISEVDPVDWDLTLRPSSPLIDAGVCWIPDPNGTISDISAYGGYRAAGW